jgi:hypothetical protein
VNDAKAPEKLGQTVTHGAALTAAARVRRTARISDREYTTMNNTTDSPERFTASDLFGLVRRKAFEKMKEESERHFFTDDAPRLDEPTRKRLFQKALAELPRWITPDDPLPEFPDWLKPNAQDQTREPKISI